MSGRATIVLGLGATGYSCVRHLAGRDRLLAFDTRERAPYRDAVATRYPMVELPPLGDWERAVGDAGRVVVSPGIAMDHELVRAAVAAGVETTSDIEIFLGAAERPVVGITGTNGKSTVTRLVADLLAANGLTAPAGGNLGTPALDLLGAEADAYVLELSSFQLERLDAPGLAAACLLNVTPDHLDRYPDFDAYVAAKQRIFAGAGCAICNGEDDRTAPPPDFDGERIVLNGDPQWRLDGADLIAGSRRLATDALALQGKHNHFNALAAAAVASRLCDLDTLAPLADAAGLPHRALPVASIGGVAYINDSKATNVGATQAALGGLGGCRDIVLIAGGDAKGAAFDALAPAVAKHVAQLVLVGRDAKALGEALGGSAPIACARDMRHAVAIAAETARPGQTVLLSPACASFDMYKDYRQRGADFEAAVRALEARR